MPNKAQTLLADLQKKFGENKVMMASQIPVGDPISTGSLALDFATSFGGFPSNRVVEICGKEGTGKTTLALMTMLNALKLYPDKSALFLDIEHKIDKDWMEMIVGSEVLANRVFYIQPSSIENATNIYRQALESGLICMAILDSIGGAPTVRRNEDAEVGHYGGNALGVGEWSRTAATYSSIYNCLTVGINQTRVDMSGYNQLITPGGRAWTHAPVLRIELVRGKDTETIRLPGEEKPVPVGFTVFAKVRKNQVGPPGRTAFYWFYHIPTEDHEFGIDTLDEITRLSIITRVVELRGGYYYHQALPKGQVQGLLKLKEAVRTDEALRATIVSEVLASLKDHAAEVAPLSDPDAPIDGVLAVHLTGGE